MTEGNEKLKSHGVKIASVRDGTHSDAAGLSSDNDQRSSPDGTCTKQLQFSSETTICDLHNYVNDANT